MNSEDLRLKHFQTKTRTSKDSILPETDSGQLATTWWAQKWLQTFAYFQDDKRVIQGKNYALKGQVIDLKIQPGVIDAKVLCKKIKPFTVKIEMNILDDLQWQTIIEFLTKKANYIAKILIGKLPEELADFTDQKEIDLFPQIRDDLQAGCSCPDWAIPCKHIAAVYYLITSLLNQDPFLLFEMRGRTQTEIVEIVKQQRRKLISQKLEPILNDESEILVQSKQQNPWLMQNEIIDDSERSNDFLLKDLFKSSPFMISSVELNQLLKSSYLKAKKIVDSEDEEMV